ncbi:hypothetical protein HOY82DRAFT_482828, partial [Tuber indicum]
RKRAKTEAEKEQRRIERVLRNRAAAQASRERKLKEVVSLQTETARLSEDNIELKAQILAQESANSVLSRELEAIKQTLKSYEEYLKVEFRGITSNLIISPWDLWILTSYFESPDPSTQEAENLFQFLLSDAAAPDPAIDLGTLEWRGSLGQIESVVGVDFLS